MPSTRLTDLVGCTAPVQSAPMGPVTMPELVGAVATAGGLGTLSMVTLGPPENVGRVLDSLTPAAPGEIAVNVLIPIVDPATLEVAASKARVVDFFWGDPDAALVARVHQGGALASWQVGSRDEAVAAADAGCDFVIAQGTEAGGHVRGNLSLLPLLDDVLEAVDVPVLASGGISTARAAAAAYAAGADGVRVGTRFLAAREADIHPDYLAAILAASNHDSVPTGRFSAGCLLCPSTHRVLRSALEAAEAFDGDVVGEMRMAGQAFELPLFSGTPASSTATGHVEAMVLYAGQGVGGVREVQPAAEIVRELGEGAHRLVAARA